MQNVKERIIGFVVAVAMIFTMIPTVTLFSSAAESSSLEIDLTSSSVVRYDEGDVFIDGTSGVILGHNGGSGGTAGKVYYQFTTTAAANLSYDVEGKYYSSADAYLSLYKYDETAANNIGKAVYENVLIDIHSSQTVETVSVDYVVPAGTYWVALENMNNCRMKFYGFTINSDPKAFGGEVESSEVESSEVESSEESSEVESSEVESSEESSEAPETEGSKFTVYAVDQKDGTVGKSVRLDGSSTPTTNYISEWLGVNIINPSSAGRRNFGVPFEVPALTAADSVKVEIYARGDGRSKVSIVDADQNVIGSSVTIPSDWKALKEVAYTYEFSGDIISDGTYYASFYEDDDHINIWKIVVTITVDGDESSTPEESSSTPEESSSTPEESSSTPEESSSVADSSSETDGSVINVITSPVEGEDTTVTVTVPEDGTYEVVAVLSQKATWSWFKIQIDDATVDESNFLGEDTSSSKSQSFGEVELTAGEHKVYMYGNSGSSVYESVQLIKVDNTDDSSADDSSEIEGDLVTETVWTGSVKTEGWSGEDDRNLDFGNQLYTFETITKIEFVLENGNQFQLNWGSAPFNNYDNITTPGTFVVDDPEQIAFIIDNEGISVNGENIKLVEVKVTGVKAPAQDYTVVYEDMFGNVLMQYSVSEPGRVTAKPCSANLNVQGYTFLGWAMFTSSLQVVEDPTEVILTPGTTTFVARYEVTESTYNVTVTGGRVYVKADENDDAYTQKVNTAENYVVPNYAKIKLVAPETNAGGEIFNCWLLNGFIYSQESELFFSTWADANFEASYEVDAMASAPYAYIDETVTLSGFESAGKEDNKITFNCAFYVPEGVTVQEMGVIYTNANGYNDLENLPESGTYEATPSSCVKIVVDSSTLVNGQTMVSLSGTSDTAKRYARTYIVYSIDGENVEVVYSQATAVKE